MKVLVVGHSGTIGQAVVKALMAHGHEVVGASRKSGVARVDITNEASIKAMYKTIGQIDAVVVTSGSVPFKPFRNMTAEDFQAGFNDKALGQIRLVLAGIEHLSDGGSITLTSGILSHEPVPQAAVASTVNGAIESFAMAAAAELKRGIRINIVSPTIVTESLAAFGSSFAGFRSVDADVAAQAYVRSVMGIASGQIFEV